MHLDIHVDEKEKLLLIQLSFLFELISLRGKTMLVRME